MTGVQTCALPILRELRGVRADYRKGFGALVDQTKSPLVSMMETKRETIRRLEQQIRDIKLQIKAAKRGDLNKVASDLDDMMKAIKGEKELLSSEFARNIDSIKGEIEGLDAKKQGIIKNIEAEIRNIKLQIQTAKQVGDDAVLEKLNDALKYLNREKKAAVVS